MPKKTQAAQPTELNLASLAEQFDELAQVCIAISGTFRAASGEEAAEADEPAPAKRGAPAKRARVAKPDPEPEIDELDLDTVRAKLKELAEAKGKDAMVAALEHVGATKLADVEEDQYQELHDHAQELIDAADEEPEDEPPAKNGKPAAKKAKAKKAPTLEDVQAAAEALEEADPKAYKKLAKKVGDLDELDEDDYQDTIDSFEAAMPE